jgi:DNA-binding beta-propeller fold protein YncE
MRNFFFNFCPLITNGPRMYRTVVICPFLALTATFGCQHEQGIKYSEVTEINYSQHVQRLFNENCTSCHRTGADSAGLKLDSWDKLVDGPHPLEQGAGPLEADAVQFLARWVDEGARNDAGATPYADASRLLYVCDQDAARVSVIDIDAQLVIRTVNLLDLGFPINSNPHHVAVEPDGSFWYLSLIGQNKVLKFNRNNELISEATISIPALLAAHPTNGLLYVSRFPQAPGEIPQLISVIDRNSFEVREDIAVRPTPHALAADNSGNFIYTCSLSRSEVIVIDSANEVEEIIPLGAGKGPIQLAVAPDDQTLFVSAQISNEMFVIDVSDPSSRAIIDTVPVNSMPWHPIVTPDGAHVYVGNNGANTITAIDVATKEVTVIGNGSGLDGIAEPHGIAVTGDGQFVFVSSRNITGAYRPRHNFGDNDRVGTLVVVNTSDNTIAKVIEVEEFGSGVAISEQ